jgi:serine/threonine-protein kinase
VPTAIQPGAIIEGKYRVVRHIGEGGMGTVFEGENVRIERRVAIKVLNAEVASTPEFLARFDREARAAARVGSPHICDVLDSGQLDNGERFIVMEYLDGESLDDRLSRGRMSCEELAPIAFEILEGLRTMHEAGVIHRDLKPANVFLVRRPGGRGRGEVVKILDFGVAKLLPRAGEAARMTATGVMIGTPLYMSPEQARGAREVDGRTDLYAASVMFYRALTGRVPHVAANLHELLFKIVLEEPAKIRSLAPDVDSEFEDLVMHGLAREAENRFSSAREYQAALAAWGKRQGRPALAFEVADTPPPPAPGITQPVAGGAEPAPAVATTQVSSGAHRIASAKAQTSSGPSLKSDGTPIVWSEDAPRVVQEAVLAREQQEQQREAPPKTLPFVPVPQADRVRTEMPVASVARPAGWRGTRVGTIAAVGGLVAAGAFIAGRLFTSSVPTTATSTMKVAVTAPAEPSATPPAASTTPPPVATAAPAPSEVGSVVDAPGSVDAPPVASAPVRVAPAARPVAPPPVAKGTPPAPPASSPAPTPTTSARKFRTTLD